MPISDFYFMEANATYLDLLNSCHQSTLLLWWPGCVMKTVQTQVRWWRLWQAGWDHTGDSLVEDTCIIMIDSGGRDHRELCWGARGR